MLLLTRYEEEPQRRTVLACGNTHRYRAIRPPTCNNGQPCRRCVQKWEQAQKPKAPLPNKSRIHVIPQAQAKG
jgi:hypothetical protein